MPAFSNSDLWKLEDERWWTAHDEFEPELEEMDESDRLEKFELETEMHIENSARGAENQEQSGWVLERDDSPACEPAYWAAGQIDPTRSSAWTGNHMAAIRFARREDAQAVADRLMKKAGVNVRVCEHIWS